MLKRFMLACGLCLGAQALEGKESVMQEYLNFIKGNGRVFGEMGDYKQGKIEIVTDPKKITEIEELQKMRFIKKGMSVADAENASRAGVIYKDVYWMWVRDAVIFPTGAGGMYNRLVQQSSFPDGIPGVAVMPLFSDGRIGLVVNYRHATRCWQLELPRGHKVVGEPLEEAAARELKEETGFVVKKIEYLGEITPDSGCLSSIVPVYIGYVDSQGMASPDYSEAILRIELFTLPQIKEAFAKGFLEIEIKGRKEKVKVCDGFLSYAIFQAECKKIL
jgi:ADP-ribose pyrophosphatase